MKVNYDGLLEGSTKSSDIGFVCSMLLKSGYSCSSISRHTGIDLEIVEKLSRDGIKHGVYPHADKNFKSDSVIRPFKLDACEVCAAQMFLTMKLQKIDFAVRRVLAKTQMTLTQLHQLRSQYGSEANFPPEYRDTLIDVPVEDQKKSIVVAFMTGQQMKAGFYVRSAIWMNIVELSFMYLKPWDWTLNFTGDDSAESLFEELAEYHATKKVLTIDDFIESHCIVDSNQTSTPREIFAAYCDWCELNKVEKTTINGFGKLLSSKIQSLVVKRTQVNQERSKIYVGIGLKETSLASH